MISGLPDNLPSFTEEQKENIILKNSIYAWIVNNSDLGSSWEISRYGWGFELSYLKRGGYHYIGKVWWNLTWIASPFDGETKGFDSFVDAIKYIEGFLDRI
jgi:hypothetical protein